MVGGGCIGGGRGGILVVGGVRYNNSNFVFIPVEKMAEADLHSGDEEVQDGPVDFRVP